MAELVAWFLVAYTFGGAAVILSRQEKIKSEAVKFIKMTEEIETLMQANDWCDRLNKTYGLLNQARENKNCDVEIIDGTTHIKFFLAQTVTETEMIECYLRQILHVSRDENLKIKFATDMTRMSDGTTFVIEVSY
jgi:hypothetical protein